MKTEDYWAYKAFIRDDAGEQALNNSEIFMAYKRAEEIREQELAIINAQEAELEKEAVLNAFEDFQNKIDNNPELKAYLKKVKAHLDDNELAASKTDPNFITALNLLNFEE